MPPLRNTRHEIFSQAVFKGRNQTEAAIEAGYTKSRARKTGSDLGTNRVIIERIAELHEATASLAVMDVRERKQRLSQIARGDITDYQTSDGIHIDKDSRNTGAIEGLEIKTGTSRDSQAGNITIKRPVVPEAMRNTIFERDGNKCVLCSSTDNLQLDHTVSLSKGGHTIASNLQTLCEKCNKVKGAGKKSQQYITTKLKLHNPITAIDLLNKMGGDYPPSKVEVEPGEKLGEALTELLSRLRGTSGNQDKE